MEGRGGRGVDEYPKVLVDIQVQLGRIEKTLEAVPALSATLEATKELARDADQSAKSAHHRLNKIDKIIFWLVTTVIGAVILAIIKLVTEGRG
ncbi:hypothetical protein EJP82_01215 [Paenibacillus anaericanus]|uniref:Hemolysin XhlA n=1 Tax=Paenibacillus anaericanus TaxID=170367 RepID=A0A3S1BSN2_9BACL|nr:hemolysin XhlA family protein [Paenibacillus anaericanus]RUT48590.1 hypothetical protein EJP82_01215 [Paenibacillus anaericanus]